MSAAQTMKAGSKAAGIVIDDAAVTPRYVVGFAADREMPIIAKIAWGSIKNKLLILLPAALALSFFAPWAITPLLMLGGAYLCYEGFEKLAHRFLHSKAEDSAHEAELAAALADPAVDLAVLERDKIKGAIRTDFVLSAEIIVIALGTVADAAFGKQVMVLSAIAVIMTIGVYGLVAGIVKLDDAGLHLSTTAGPGVAGRLQRRIGEGLLAAAPLLMKFLSVAGTVAMFMVGGGILTHGMPFLHDAIHHAVAALSSLPAIGGVLQTVAGSLLDALAGVVAGGIVLVVVQAAQRVWRPASA